MPQGAPPSFVATSMSVTEPCERRRALGPPPYACGRGQRDKGEARNLRSRPASLGRAPDATGALDSTQLCHGGLRLATGVDGSKQTGTRLGNRRRFQERAESRRRVKTHRERRALPLESTGWAGLLFACQRAGSTGGERAFRNWCEGRNAGRSTPTRSCAFVATPVQTDRGELAGRYGGPAHCPRLS